jgi:hypothetical protein
MTHDNHDFTIICQTVHATRQKEIQSSFEGLRTNPRAKKDIQTSFEGLRTDVCLYIRVLPAVWTGDHRMNLHHQKNPPHSHNIQIPQNKKYPNHVYSN